MTQQPARQPPAVTRQPHRSRARLWVFRLLACTLVPAMFFVALEFGLRVVGVGYDARFFVSAPVAGRALMGNPRFGWTYFTPAIARKPEPMVLADPKPAGTYRIVLLGSSAAMGFPEPAFGMARQLDAMLRDAFPGAKFEVVNAAMVAINSNVVRQIAADAASEQPDLFIVYEGNNEVIGPWGPGTVFAGFSPSSAGIRANVALRRLRLGQLITSAVGGLSAKKKDALTEWTGMEMFLGSTIAQDDPRLAVVADRFAQNLRDITAVARAANAGVILCTVGVNTRDCAPFASLHTPGLSEQVKSDFTAAVGRADELLKTDPAGALAQYDAALALDDRFADLHFKRARALEALQKFDDARAAYQRALDLDALRFRTDSRLNDAVRRVASESAGDSAVSLVDVEAVFRAHAASPGGLVGAGLLYEHCHMNFEGNHAVAGALFKDVITRLPAAIRAGASPDLEPPPAYRVAAMLGYTPAAELRMSQNILELMQRPPFTLQYDHADSAGLVKRRVDAVKAQITPAAVAGWRRASEPEATRAPNDWQLHRQLSALAIQEGDLSGAEAHLRAVLAAVPFHVESALELGGVLAKKNDFDAAERVYRESMRSPYSSLSHESEVFFSLGIIDERRGNTAGATANYTESLARSPSNPKPMTNLGLMLLRAGKAAEAETWFRKVADSQPHLSLAWINLSLAQSAQKKFTDAEASLRRLVELDPSSAAAHTGLGDALALAGKPGEAAEAFRAAERLAPNSPEVKVRLAKSLIATGDRPGADAALNAALKLNPNLSEARELLKSLTAAGTKP